MTDNLAEQQADSSSRCWREEHPYSRGNPKFPPTAQPRQDRDALSDGPGAGGNDPPDEVYSASCHCGRVAYRVLGPPVDAKLCHCRSCQKLHGAPFEWVCIFRKRDVRFSRGHDDLFFYSSELDRGWSADDAGGRVLPVKVGCANCRTPIADEGRNMWLAFGTLFDFDGGVVPDSFRHTCHLFYGQSCIDLGDDKPKWAGHKNRSALL